ncbi:MAG: hypothetical protein LBV02_00490 [Bacteroidales bacterium]|jgi:N-acetylglucosamine kinase-like BadF-type ATPase|nr:hypothetical protein [Bacteroidales bacterium]
MKVIIDSGASKSEYIVLGDGVCYRYKNSGININYLEDEQVLAIFQDFANRLPTMLSDGIRQIVYYGAGCGKRENVKRVMCLLADIFPEKEIAVHSDLLAACHALYHTHPGWVAILGTGSASCMYDGEKITEIAPSLGFILGDEGSGTHLGKLFLIRYLSNNLSHQIVTLFESETNADRKKIMERIYREAYPNRYMASIAQFLGNHQHNETIRKICLESFTEFFVRQSSHFKENELHGKISIIGSVGFHFQEIVRDAADRLKIEINKIIATPGDELIRFHSNK